MCVLKKSCDVKWERRQLTKIKGTFITVRVVVVVVAWQAGGRGGGRGGGW